MTKSTKSNKKVVSRKKATNKNSSQELPKFAGLSIKRVSAKSKTQPQQPKNVFQFEITDFEALAKDLEIKKNLAAMTIKASLEDYQSTNDPSDALREARKAYLDVALQAARLAGEKVDEARIESERAKGFLEGLSLSNEEHIEVAKGYFFNSIFLFARLPLDPRREINLMIDALEQIRKTLPRRKPGRKEDESIARAWRRIDFEGMKQKEAFKLYCNEEGIENLQRGNYIEFGEKIRKKRSETKKKEARKTVALKSQQNRRKSRS